VHNFNVPKIKWLHGQGDVKCQNLENAYRTKFEASVRNDQHAHITKYVFSSS